MPMRRRSKRAPTRTALEKAASDAASSQADRMRRTRRSVCPSIPCGAKVPRRTPRTHLKSERREKDSLKRPRNALRLTTIDRQHIQVCPHTALGLRPTNGSRRCLRLALRQRDYRCPCRFSRQPPADRLPPDRRAAPGAAEGPRAPAIRQVRRSNPETAEERQDEGRRRECHGRCCRQGRLSSIALRDYGSACWRCRHSNVAGAASIRPPTVRGRTDALALTSRNGVPG